MKKTGHALTALTGVPEPFVRKLQELSVTTIEEFLDLASRHRSQLQSFLDLDDEAWSRLIEQSRESLSPAELKELFEPQPGGYPFRTGHDAPRDGTVKRVDDLEQDDD